MYSLLTRYSTAEPAFRYLLDITLGDTRENITISGCQSVVRIPSGTCSHPTAERYCGVPNLISARFDPRFLDELLIRPLTAHEKPAHPSQIRFYLEDGNHRALVYTVSLRLQTETYQPVRAIFSGIGTIFIHGDS